MNQTRRRKTRRPGQPVLYRFRHLCASGNSVELEIERGSRKKFGQWQMQWAEPFRPGDQQEYEQWLKHVQATISRLAGRKLKLTFWEEDLPS